MVCYTPDELWLISRLFDVVVAEVPPVLLSSTWRDLLPYPNAQSLSLPSFAFLRSLHHSKPCTLTTRCFWSLGFLPKLWYTPLIFPGSGSSLNLIAFCNCSSSSLANMPSAEIFTVPWSLLSPAYQHSCMMLFTLEVSSGF